MNRLPTRAPPLLGGILAALLAASPGPETTAAAAAAPSDGAVRIAVLDFADTSTEAGWAPLGKGLQSMLTTDLSALSGLTLVERARLTEIQAELQLGKDGWTDPKSAARIGALAQASHLLGGSFAVVGDHLRIDARLITVEHGTVVFGAQVEGEREAFFELEKELVSRLQRELVATAPPKERAVAMSLHTADFTAFAAFSRGIDAFDRGAYDAALTHLREATDVDAGFRLARLTLGQYERLIEQLQSRSTALQAARIENERLARSEAAMAEQKSVERLLFFASQPGEAAHRTRLAALHILTLAFGNIGSHGRLADLRRQSDHFSFDRAAGRFAAAYHREAISRFPALPPGIEDCFYRGLPEEAEVEGELRWFAERLFDGDHGEPENQKNLVRNSLRDERTLARLLHLDRAEEVALQERFNALAARLDPSTPPDEHEEERLAKAYRSVLRLGDSTRLWAGRGRRSTNEWGARAAAEEVDLDRRIQHTLDRSRNPKALREFFQLGVESWSWEPLLGFAEEHLLGETPTPKAEAQLERFRELDDDEWLHVGAVPTLVLQCPFHLRSGPRSEARRTQQIHYDRPDPERDADPILVLGDEERARFRARFRWSVQAGAPNVELWFGLRDLRVPKEDDPAGGPDRLVAPMRGSYLRIAEGAASWGSFEELRRGPYDRTEELRSTEVGRKPWAGSTWELDGCGAAWVIRDAQGRSAALPPPEPGWVAMRWSGSGQGRVEGLVLEGCGGT